MTRPHIICHMITSIDGRLLADRWPCEEEELLEVYDAAAARLDADGWIVGRTTMEAHYLEAADPAPLEEIGPRDDHIAPEHDALSGIGICIDRTGRLRPESGDIDGAHLVMVLGEQASRAHVEMLVARGVSVVFLGSGGGALADALARIALAFGARRLILEGGGEINGAFLAEGLIDETSTLVYPVVDGQGGIPAIYEHRGTTVARGLELIAVETLDKGCVWMRHRVLTGGPAALGGAE
ncbi:dihydrofolate reductase family protein [Alloyangia pacifica]|uniref:5-amino-6-(5-phosphoribosylamino)uracil reductase n=1 Tax=Alloyangia pacifica TaxID=311180 RepID=A0A1I6WG31_9RHOB|nr:dihydrofolate reductase family protein [Alloyangia pacifica]SDI63679.1 5-amino-6-(5-phosphoribosylamino)uracil reductase [Alloyangia pacifica]SFT24534.1 5-amino-6-(5-phosphoribosylamino)uracil reductase [Alloyangia pacifica]